MRRCQSKDFRASQREREKIWVYGVLFPLRYKERGLGQGVLGWAWSQSSRPFSSVGLSLHLETGSEQPKPANHCGNSVPEPGPALARDAC